MALSYVQYPGDGVKKDFQLTFSYLARSHVTVSVGGENYPDFAFTSPFVVRLATAPANGQIVEVRRTTPREAPLVDFVDGSTLTETDLDTATLQTFFLAQEAFDLTGGTLAISADGSYSASTRRITLLGNPVNAQDAVTRQWAETAMSSQLAQATQKASEAAGSAGTATTKAGEAATSAQSANTSATTATNKASAAATSEAQALAYKNQTQADREATAADRVQTGLDRQASAASAAAALKSAQDAALFEPSTYYTKVQVDAVMGGKASLSGAAFTGNLSISNVSPTISLVDTDGGVTNQLHYNGGLIGFLGTNGDWLVRWDNAGGMWTRQLGDINARIEARAAAFADDRRNQCVTSSQSAGYVTYRHASGTATTYSGYFVTYTYRVGGDQYEFGFRQPQLYIPNRGWFAAFPF